jgi:hypothetical protein
MHLDAAYRLACWPLRDETEAEDAVQEAYLRAPSMRTSCGCGRSWNLMNAAQDTSAPCIESAVVLCLKMPFSCFRRRPRDR